MRNARSVGVLQQRHASVSRLNREGGDQVSQGTRTTGEVQQAVCACIVIVPIRIILMVGAMVVGMPIASKLRMFCSVHLVELRQQRRYDQAEHQQRQKAGAQNSRQLEQMRMHLKKITRILR